jgi:hypothetical protein
MGTPDVEATLGEFTRGPERTAFPSAKKLRKLGKTFSRNLQKFPHHQRSGQRARIPWLRKAQSGKGRKGPQKEVRELPIPSPQLGPLEGSPTLAFLLSALLYLAGQDRTSGGPSNKVLQRERSFCHPG